MKSQELDDSSIEAARKQEIEENDVKIGEPEEQEIVQQDPVVAEVKDSSNTDEEYS